MTVTKFKLMSRGRLLRLECQVYAIHAFYADFYRITQAGLVILIQIQYRFNLNAPNPSPLRTGLKPSGCSLLLPVMIRVIAGSGLGKDHQQISF